MLRTNLWSTSVEDQHHHTHEGCWNKIGNNKCVCVGFTRKGQRLVLVFGRKDADWIYWTMSYFSDSLSIDCDKFAGQLATPKVVASAGPYSDTKSPYIVTIRGIGHTTKPAHRAEVWTLWRTRIWSSAVEKNSSGSLFVLTSNFCVLA